MNLMSKLVTALRCSMRQTRDYMANPNSLRIFEQQIHDCEATIQLAKHEVCHVMAETIKLKQDCGSLNQTIALKEAQAIAAIEMGEHNVANTIASFIAQNEQILDQLKTKLEQLEVYEIQLKQNLNASVLKVQDYRRELHLTKAIASAQRATAVLAGNPARQDTQTTNLERSLQRIKQQQLEASDQVKAADLLNDELSGYSLEEQLKAAGISATTDRATAVLERLHDKVIKANSNPND